MYPICRLGCLCNAAKFEERDDEFFNVISPFFDSEGGVVHGLHHYRNRDDLCDCPRAGQRQLPANFQPRIPLGNRRSNLSGRILLDEVYAGDGNLLLVGPGAAELPLRPG